MLYIKNRNTEPYFNMAAEEYIMERFDGDILTLWRNEKAVILGRNQNFYSEINTNFARENKISVVRRLSGGGCVFHDLGNINFTFICDSAENLSLNFAHFTAPVIGALQNIGLSAELLGRNDIMIDGKKVSGNAQCVYKNALGKEKILHHGTLLYNADMDCLSGVLNADEEKIKSKGIKSVKNRVGNIYDMLPDDKKTPVEGFLSYVEDYLIRENNYTVYEFSADDRREIESLAEKKYKSESYLYGRSGDYEYRKKQRFDCGTVEISFNTVGFKICEFKINGDFFGVRDISELENRFNNVPHKIEDVNNILKNVDINTYINGLNCENFVNLLF